MRLLNCSVENFGSYASLEFDFDNHGLALIQGATGSGKSTLFDIPTWCLFGVTAKNGTVDEVRSWTSPDRPTQVMLRLEIGGEIVVVTRVRGTSGQNDLRWVEKNCLNSIRGKDMAETQKLLNQRLGIDEDLYLSAAYFCEFSPTYGFFSANAKGRRALFEKVADLSLPVRLSEAAAKRQKELKKLLTECNKKLAGATATARAEYESYQSSGEYFNAWAEKHERELSDLQTCADNFDMEKASTVDSLQTKCDRFEQDRADRLEKLAAKAVAKEDALVELGDLRDLVLTKEQALKSVGGKCESCGAPKNHAQREEIQGQISRARVKVAKLEAEKDILDGLIRQIEGIQAEENPYPEQLAAAKKMENRYLAQLKQAKTADNPHEAQMDKFYARWEAAEANVGQLTSLVAQQNAEALTLSQLTDLSLDLRGALLQKAVAEAERRTNTSLDSYFDAELRVKFELEGSDNLDVAIYKNGYSCTYRQLSKGQRSLLRLCFSVSIMQMASHQSGVHFDQLFFDEPTDGCDVAMKQKAFGLLEKLSSEHDSVFAIEHSTELKSSFTKAFNVELAGDLSTITEQE